MTDIDAAGLSLADALQLGQLDAHAQAALRRAGELSASALVEAAILRIEALDPQLAAVSHRAWAQARARARQLPAAGPMAGVPYLLKDSLDYPGMPSLAGSRSRNGRLAAAAHAFAQRYDGAGLVAVGKSAMPEFGLLPSTEPLLGRPTRNPWRPGLSPGGSSGGAAAAVAAGLVPLAHGSDGAGSIRIPASCCGVVGLKPGRGGVARARGRHLLEDLLVGDSLLSRTVRDTAWAFAAAHPDAGRAMVAGPARRRLRIALVAESLDGAPPQAEVAAAIERTAALCIELGHRVEAASWPLDGAAAMRALRVLWAHLAAEDVALVRAEQGAQRLEDVLEPWTLHLAEQAERLPVAALETAYRALAALPDALAAFFGQYDVVLSPVLRTPPPPLGALAPDQPFEALQEAFFDWVSYTPLQNLTGTPAISLPLSATADGVPIGSMFAAGRGDEDRLLELAYELEAAAGWQHRWPPLSVAGALAGDGR